MSTSRRQLSPVDLGNFARDGYLILPDFSPERACAALRTRAREIVSAANTEQVSFSARRDAVNGSAYFLHSGDKVRCFFEEEAWDDDGRLRQPLQQSINKIGHALHDLDPVFDDFSRSADVADLVAQLGMQQPLLLQSMYIFKPPHIGGEVTCHQDATFLYTDPISVVGLWWALEDATLDNGCLWVVPGGHRQGLKARFLRHGDQVRHEIYDPTPWPEEALRPITAKAGTLVLLHGCLPHASRPNRSPHSRHAYTLHIIDGNSAYAADNWLQRAPDMPLRGFDSARTPQ